MEEIHEEIKEAVKQLETYKNRYRTMNTQDVIDMLKRLNENVKLTIPVVGNSLPDKDYWKERCKLVEFIEEVNPCDPDINQEQIEAWNKYRAFLKEHGIRQ
jgi:hypothetical protein